MNAIFIVGESPQIQLAEHCAECAHDEAQILADKHGVDVIWYWNEGTEQHRVKPSRAVQEREAS